MNMMSAFTAAWKRPDNLVCTVLLCRRFVSLRCLYYLLRLCSCFAFTVGDRDRGPGGPMFIRCVALKEREKAEGQRV